MAGTAIDVSAVAHRIDRSTWFPPWLVWVFASGALRPLEATGAGRRKFQVAGRSGGGERGGTGPPRLFVRSYEPGMITLSITWITPFDASTSAVVTLASSTITPPSVMIVTSLPSTVPASMPFVRSVDITLPGTTW
jgi:hypothetical protein